MISLPDFGLQRGSACSPTLAHACFSLTNMNPRVTMSVSVSAHSSVRPAADDCLNPPCSPMLTCIRPRPVLTHIRPRLVLTSTRSLLERESALRLPLLVLHLLTLTDQSPLPRHRFAPSTVASTSHHPVHFLPSTPPRPLFVAALVRLQQAERPTQVPPFSLPSKHSLPSIAPWTTSTPLHAWNDL